VADAVWGVLFIAAWVLTGKLKERNA
jgi:hypothetical protein